MLVLIATPIGNLGDISPRGREALRTCDVLLCEDTRHTGMLYKMLQIPAPSFMSLHRFNESAQQDHVISLLKEGKIVGVVSDAGMPGISDPGESLVARCHEEGIRVSVIPGPCAFVSAYTLSGAKTDRFQFVGFLPKPKGERVQLLKEMILYPGATVVYESPFRLVETLQSAAEVCGEWTVTVVRELTKLHEEVVRKRVADLIAHFQEREVRGECTIVFHPVERKARLSDEQLVSEVAACRSRFGCSLKEAVELVVLEAHVPQKELYKLCVKSAQ